MEAAALSDIERLHDKRWWTLGVLCLSLMIVIIGNSSLNVALPTLSRELHASESQLQWIVASYSLVFAGLLFSTGALGDRYGRKGTLQLGLAIFLVAATFAAFSGEMWQLIACRAVMGAAAALIMPATLSILINVFPPGERTKAIAIWASLTGAAGGFGPVISGWLLGHFWYGSVFLINVPVIVVALVAGRFLVPRSRDPEEGNLDPVGAVLSIIGIVALVFGLIEAPERGWLSAPTITAFIIAAIVLTLFVLWELRVAEPMLDMRLFKNPAFSTGSSGMILLFMAMYGDDVPRHPVLPARARLHPAERRGAVVADGDDPARHLAVHAAHHQALRRQPHGGRRDGVTRRRDGAALAARARHPTTGSSSAASCRSRAAWRWRCRRRRRRSCRPCRPDGRGWARR